jgi:hypothetical protein
MATSTPHFGTAHDAAKAIPIPGLSEVASERRHMLLFRRGTYPRSVAFKAGERRVVFNLDRLAAWWDTGGELPTAARPAASEPEQPAAAV